MGKKCAAKSVDSLIWQWVENVDCSNITLEEIRTSYHLCLPCCKDCKKNCSGNPRCLHGLGESHWLNIKSSLEEYEQLLNNVKKENEAERRKPGDLVGLRNLGATCYVNTYLQLWFHNLDFRRALFALAETTDPNSIFGQLQLIFGLLQHSVTKCVDPSSFIECLGLATDLQQDAQEFSKLLMNILETIPELSQVIQNQFSGEYAYETKCQSCDTVKRNPSKFYELDLNIQGHKDLNSCILEFLQQEHLKGENQYFCDSCCSKQDAVRQIKLQKLPQTLSIQLLRFVYDRATQCKHKISTNISFPDTLDFSTFMEDDLCVTGHEVLEYHLSAVLIHRGPSASSGHFVAHILDSESGDWYKFNDEVIVKMKSGKKLDLGNTKGEEDIWKNLLTEPPAKRPKIPKGYHSSKDVYMLVYSRKSMVEQQEKLSTPTRIQQLVDENNKLFEEKLENAYCEAHGQLEEKQQQQENMSLFIKLLNSKSENYEFVPTALLKYFFNPNKPKENQHSLKDNNKLCSHGKLSLEKVSFMKYIPKCAADIIYSDHRGIQRICDDMMCLLCVQNHCMMLQSKKRLLADYSLVNNTMKSFSSCDLERQGAFYVGRLSMRQWRSIALKNLLKKYQQQSAVIKSTSVSEQKEEPDCNALGHAIADEDDIFFVNHDIICEHHNLTTDAGLFQVVPQFVWEILYNYFPASVSFKVSECKPCLQCSADIEGQELEVQRCRIKAQEQKMSLNNLFFNKKRPSYERVHTPGLNPECKTELFYVVSADFVRKWQEFVRFPDRNDEVTHLNNEIFLCSHKKLLYDLSVILQYNSECDSESSVPGCILLWEEEWEYIKTNFFVDYIICMSKTVTFPCKVMIKKLDHEPLDLQNPAKLVCDTLLRNDETATNLSVLIQSNCNLPQKHLPVQPLVSMVVSPEMCAGCMRGLANEDHKRLCTYENADIYVIKSTKTLKEMEEQRKSVSSDSEIALVKTAIYNGSSARRSIRSRRCARGEKKLNNISSNMTLKQLKLKIMLQFSVPPYDQNLWLNDKLLWDDGATLGSLSVTPECTLTLVEDLPNEVDVPVVFETAKFTEPEAGFKGTGLLGYTPE